jgi:hypothetical protein
LNIINNSFSCLGIFRCPISIYSTAVITPKIKNSVSVVCCAITVTIYLIIISVIIQIFKMSSREKSFLIGYMNHQITGSKLPSRGDCLKVLFYSMRITKLNLNDNAILVI